MGFLDFLRKRQDTPQQYMDASVTVMDRSGRPKQPSFNYHAAVRHYSSWIYAAATINAQAVAANPLRLYVKSRPGAKRLYDTRQVPKRRKAYLCGDLSVQPSRSVMRKALAGDFEEVSFDHPMLEVLRKANSVDDGFGLAITRILFLELTGNAYLHPVFDSTLNVPTELWTMPSQYVKVIPSTDGLIAGYRYGVEPQAEMDFMPDEVIHFKRPNPRSLLYGMGKCEAAWGVIQQNAAIHDMDLSMFENMARPDYAIIVKSAGREQLDRFETKVREALQGTRKAGKFFAMSGDVDMKPLSFPTKDLAGRDEIVEEIAAVFGVPVSMLKANDPNLAASKSGYAQWRESTIAPICRLDEETLNAKLLPMFGLEETAYLAYDNPVPQDRQQDLVERQTAVAGGWMTPNEARLESGYEAAEDPAADRLYVNGQPLGGQPAGVPALPFGFSAPARPLAQPVEPEPQQQAWEDPTLEDTMQHGKRLALPAAKQDDCVSDKIRTMLDEGYPQEQAIAIAISMCEGKSWSEADRAKAIEDVDTKPTEEMAALAARGLALRDEYNRGGTEVGVARARDISNRANLSEQTIRRMASYFARHRVDLDAEGARPGEDGYPSAGAIAWMLWGGDPSDPEGAGAAWAARKVEEIDRAKEKRLASRIVAEYVAEVDRGAHDADSAKIDRLLAEVEKSYMRELTDDETIRYALDGALTEVNHDIDAVLKAYGLDRDAQVAQASSEREAVIKAQGMESAAAEVEAVIKSTTGTILKGNT